MTCKDCIHSGLCYKENDFNNFPDRCGDFISDKVLEDRPQGEWIYPDADCIIGKQRIGKRWKVCSNCKKEYRNNLPWDAIFCPNCGSKNGGKEE